jgi:hypothetical protein
MKPLLVKVAVLASAAMYLLIYNGQNARAGTVGVEQFNLIDRVLCVPLRDGAAINLRFDGPIWEHHSLLNCSTTPFISKL